MRKKKLYVIIAVVFVALNLCANSLLFAQSVVLTDTEIQEDDSAVKIMFSTNRSTQVECYDLSVPPQIIIDFMGEIYTNKPEIMMVNKGVVKQMRVIRGTKKSENLDDSFYSVDFIIIDLKESMRYDFNQGLTTSVLVVSKPGKIIDVNKARNEIAKLAIEPTGVSLTTKAPFPMEDKEYEMPVKPAASKAVKTVKEKPKKKRTSREKRGRVKKVKQQKPMAEKSEASKKTIVGKIKTSIKNFFTFGKAKKEGVEPKQKRRAQKPVLASKEEAAKTEVKTKTNSKTASKKRAFRSKRRKPKEDKRAKKEKPKVVKRRKKTAQVQKPEKVKSEVNPYANAIAEAKAIAEQKTLGLDAAQNKMSIADDKLKNANSARETIGQRIKSNNAKQELLKNDYSESLQIATYAKNSANAKWVEYSEAKTKLSLFLKNEYDPEVLKGVQAFYDKKKIAMSQAIKEAEESKKESEVKLALYEKALQEGDDLLVEVDAQKKNVGIEQMQFNAAEEQVFAKRQELENAKKDVQRAQRDYQQYEIDKVEEEYKKSLFNIDQTLALEAENEVNRKEKERFKRLEEQKAEQMIRQQEIKDKEEAQSAALRQIEKNKEAEKNKEIIRRGKAKIEPKRRKVKTVEVAAEKSEMLQARTEVLSTAVELRNSGAEMQRQGDFDSAVKYYQQALISDPKYATVHNDLGILYEQKGLDDKAKMEYLAALKINPHYIRAHSNLALLYEKSGDNNKAYYHWKQRVQLGAENDPWTEKAKQRMELLEQQRK